MPLVPFLSLSLHHAHISTHQHHIFHAHNLHSMPRFSYYYYYYAYYSHSIPIFIWKFKCTSYIIPLPVSSIQVSHNTQSIQIFYTIQNPAHVIQNLLSSSSPSVMSYAPKQNKMTLENLGLTYSITEVIHTGSSTALYHASVSKTATLSLPQSFSCTIAQYYSPPTMRASHFTSFSSQSRKATRTFPFPTPPSLQSNLSPIIPMYSNNSYNFSWLYGVAFDESSGTTRS